MINFATPPNLHSQDWRGQIGGKRDPTTKVPYAGAIYDCNQHGHTIRPYVPPNLAGPHVIVWYTDDYYAAADSPILLIAPITVWAQTYAFAISKDSGPYNVTIETDYDTDPHDGTFIAILRWPGIFWRDFRREHCDLTEPQTIPADPPDPAASAYVVIDIRSPLIPTDPQAAHRAHFAAVHAAWTGLSETQRAAWNARARYKRLPAYNVFMQTNLHRAALGLPIIQTP